MKRWPLNKAWFWERMPFLRLLLPLVAGVGVYSIYDGVINNALLLGAFILLLGLLIISSARQKNSGTKYLFAFAVNASIFVMAILLCNYNDVRNDKLWFGNQLTSADAYTARIIDKPSAKERTWKLSVEVLNGINNNNVLPSTGKAFVYIYKDEKPLSLQEGDTIILPAKWQQIKNAGNPFEFDYAAYCARNNIYYRQFIAGDEVLLYAKGNATDIRWIRRIHNFCLLQLERFIKDKAALGLIQAMLIGDEINFDPELRQAYSETGIIHVVAISGSHITIFFVVIAFLLGWIKNKKYHWLKYIIAIPLIWVYVLMAGAPPSAVRAALMFTILGIGFALQKNPNNLNQLFATAFILLCAEPMWLFSVGFQLSFVAVLSLMLFYKPVYKLLSPVHIIGRVLWGSVVASIAAEILVAPLVIYYFHIFPAMFIIANVVAYVFMGLVLIAGMLIIVASGMPVIATGIGVLTASIVSVFNQLVFVFREFNPRSFYVIDLKSYELIMLYIAIGAMGIFILKKQKQALFIGLTAMCVLMCSFCIIEWVSIHQRILVVYNISKANHIELISGKYHSVITTDTSIDDGKKNYVLKPAHTSWHAWRRIQRSERELYAINDRSVLILNQPHDYTGHFPVDYIVINYKAKPTEEENITSVFQPKKIVLGTDVTTNQGKQWQEQCSRKGLALHHIAVDGAFVLEDF